MFLGMSVRKPPIWERSLERPNQISARELQFKRHVSYSNLAAFLWRISIIN
jgi:hypothetical protein